MILLISGKQGSGKTTLANRLKEELSIMQIPVATFKFAAPLYEMHDACYRVLQKYGWDKQDDKKDGDLLQLLGTEWGRTHLDPDIWAKLTKNAVNVFLYCCKDSFLPDKEGVAIIDDARFENEVNIFNRKYTLTVRLNASAEDRKKRCEYWREKQDHPSEIGLDNYNDFDVVIDTSEYSSEETFSIVMEEIKKRIKNGTND